jgi:hypothetical protein
MESRSKLIAVACLLLFGVILPAQPAFSERVVFKDIRVRFSKNSNDRSMTESPGSLIFDNTSEKLVIKSSQKLLQLAYDDVARMTLDNVIYYPGKNIAKEIFVGGAQDEARKRTLGRIILDGPRLPGPPLPAWADMANLWIVIEMKMPGGGTKSTLIEIKKEDSSAVLAMVQHLFGERVRLPETTRLGNAIDEKTLVDRNAKYTVTADKVNHPIPQIQDDKALVVAACPAKVHFEVNVVPLLKLYANGSVVAVNRPGTYSFAYLDPGEYELVTQLSGLAGRTVGFKMKLQAGQDYYFFQCPLLSRNAKEIVLYEVEGSYYSNWQRTKP